MSEEWRDIPGWPGYQASSEGRIRSFVRGKPRILTGALDRHGYRRVNVRGPNGFRLTAIHRLVLFAFTGPCPDGMEARHLDGNRINNSPANLAWGTCSENAFDRVRHGTHPATAKTHCPQGHEYSPENTYIADLAVPRRHCRECRRIKPRERAMARRLQGGAA